MEASGRHVVKVQIINDRGIHICKSMLAWQKFGAGETPESTGLKGDKLVGKYYVLFDKEYKRQQKELMASGMDAESAAKQAPILLEAQEMLRKWEQGDSEVTQLWEMMNSWVYAGFDSTYKRLGVSFEQNYYESSTYLLGREVVMEGLEKGVFYRKDDGSVWVDLTDQGLDEKLLLRSDGTSVYMTQDIGTAIQRFKDYDIDQIIYTVGNEQDYHFKVLFLILEKMGYARPGDLHHLSYGMVDLPSGKMKSREGTVVDADDLMQDMHETARAISEELGKTAGLPEEEKNQLYETIGMGALKYYMLKVDPKKRMMFNPEESIDFNGNTGPFIQYTYARIQSILRKVELHELPTTAGYTPEPQEIELLNLISEFEGVIQLAAAEHSPAQIANYTYELVKSFNSFYQHSPILNASDETQRSFRIQLSKFVGQTIKNAMYLLGIEVPSRM
jgi:arginyl-tRNA synthetase